MKNTLLLTLVLAFASCTFHSTATEFHGLVGANGKPVHVKSTTNIGFNLGIFIPFIGGTAIDTMVSSMTEDIAKENGDTVRIIESSAENYWYGFPPFTWIVTPVITTVTADYEPSAEMLNKAKQQ